MDLISFDRDFRIKGYRVIAGVDEAGRGPWAGPVVAAAVVLPQDLRIEGIRDSKKLTPRKRERLFEEIKKSAAHVGIGIIDQYIIDSVNILQATFLAMKEALGKIPVAPDLVLVDGHEIPGLKWEQTAVIGGDDKSVSIAAASIVAKVTRDRIMVEWSIKYPEYNFQKHKGYGTKEHRDALLKFGPCPLHRKSYEPVRERLGDAGHKDAG
ncbi:MAG: ribonuclease HII [Elusimicrobiota bacterium]